MVAEAGQDWPPAGDDPGHSPHPCAVRLPESVDHPRPDAGVALPGVVEQTCEEQIVVGRAVLPQGGDHVEAVAAVGDMHRIEDRELCGSEPGRQSGALLRADPSPDVRPELAGLRCPPGSHEDRR